MTEIDVIMNDVREIKWHQGSIDGSLKLLLRANKEKILPGLMNIFGKSRRRAEIYLIINGNYSVGEIAKNLDMKISNVSTEITKLKDETLIEIQKISKEGEFIYKKTELDKIFRISRELKDKFKIEN